jgi:predicted acetyltransferase
VPELRGRGLARLVLTRLLHHARERGALIATLFRTAPGPYRRLGCEEVGAMTTLAVPAAALAGLPVPPDVTLRPATAADVPAVHEVYRTLARASAGLVDRAEPLWDTSPEAVLARHDGLTVAVGPDGTVDGYAGWDRGPGYDRDSRITVRDLIGLTAPATSALLAMLGSWLHVAPTISLCIPEPDPAPLLGQFVGTRVESRERWMLRVLDAPGAVAARGWPAHLAGSVDLELEDDVCPWNAGAHRLVLEGGSGTLEPGGSGAVRLTARGLAVLYAGGVPPAILRRAGLLSGDAGADAFLAAASAGPPPSLLDYF